MKRWSFVLTPFLIAALVGSYWLGSVLQGQSPSSPAMVRELTSYRDLVKQIQPAVVSIDARGKAAHVKGQMPKNFPDDQIPKEFRKFFEFGPFGQFPFEFEMPPQHGFGSGFIIRPEGVVLTNYHVIAGADHVTVTLMDGRKFNAKDIKGDRRTDLAIVRIEDGGKKFPSLELGDSDSMEIGDRVLAFGAPFGLTGSVTHGIISAKGRNGLHMNMYEDFLQTDAAINPGNSGGPLVSLDGKVVGINAAIKSRSGGFQGVGLAVASSMAKNVVAALLRDGVVHRGFLGVQLRELDPEVAKRLGLPKGKGVVVGKVIENSPAAKAGVKDGDIITEIAGQKVKSGRQLQNVVAGLPLQQATHLTVFRDGKSVPLSVTVVEQPKDLETAELPLRPRVPAEADTIPLGKLGIQVSELTDELAQSLGYKQGTHGVFIARIDQDSIAAEAGLERGMLITRVDNQPVTTAESARQAVAKASLERGVLLQVQSPRGGTSYVLLRQGAPAASAP
jgi:serine protease Do